MATISQSTNVSMNPVDDFAELKNGVIVRRYSIIGTPHVCYVAYRKAAKYTGEYSSLLRTKTYGLLGDITTYHLPEHIALMPYGPKRSEACKAYRKSLELEAREAINAAFPEDFE